MDSTDPRRFEQKLSEFKDNPQKKLIARLRRDEQWLSVEILLKEAEYDTNAGELPSFDELERIHMYAPCGGATRLYAEFMYHSTEHALAEWETAHSFPHPIGLALQEVYLSILDKIHGRVPVDLTQERRRRVLNEEYAHVGDVLADNDAENLWKEHGDYVRAHYPDSWPLIQEYITDHSPEEIDSLHFYLQSQLNWSDVAPPELSPEIPGIVQYLYGAYGLLLIAPVTEKKDADEYREKHDMYSQLFTNLNI